jgi:hypothetical protein
VTARQPPSDYDYGRRGTKAYRLREWLHQNILRRREEGQIPTTGRFLFYEAVMAKLVEKDRKKRADGKKGRRPDQDLGDELTWLREHDDLVGWNEIVDRTRHISDYRGYPTVLDGVLTQLPLIGLDRWDSHSPLVIVESESLAGLYQPLVESNRAVLIPIRGQASSAQLFNDVLPYVQAGCDTVLYVGDYDKAGLDIENSARDRLERFCGHALKWKRVALTEEQVYDRERPLPLVDRYDRRDRQTRQVCEAEAMPQAELTRLLTEALDELRPAPLDEVHEREEAERTEIQRLLDRLRQRRRLR